MQGFLCDCFRMYICKSCGFRDETGGLRVTLSGDLLTARGHIIIGSSAIQSPDPPAHPGTGSQLKAFNKATQTDWNIQGCPKLSQIAYLQNLKFAKKLILNACSLPQV